jgi:predicted regulator of Ras-like GTPase activity (Roadblock/LC7/MglB family)
VTAHDAGPDADLVALLLDVEEVLGAVAWKLGELPRGRWNDDSQDELAFSLLAALTGSLEKGIEDLNLGQLSQIWWQTDEAQCVGFRAGEWEVLVIADPKANVGKLRTRVAGALDENWHLLDSEEE